MKGKRIFKKRYLIILGVLLIMFYFGPSILGGYSWTKYSAIRYTLPNEDGKLVFEKKFENRNIVIWDTGRHKYVKLIENNFGFLYRSTNVSGIDAEALDGKMKIAWSASQKKEDKAYDTLFAAEVLDDNIVKVIVSNEKKLDENDLSLSKVKENSTLFVEMDVKNGYAAHYSSLPYSEVGSFVFRGVNSDGNVVSIY